MQQAECPKPWSGVLGEGSSSMAHLTVEGDPLRIKQILVNIISNAIKYATSRVECSWMLYGLPFMNASSVSFLWLATALSLSLSCLRRFSLSVCVLE